MLCAYPTLPTIHDGCRQDQKQLHRIIIYSWIRRLSSKPPLKQHLICSFIALLFASWWMLLLLIITAKSRRQFLVSLGLLGVPKFTAGTAFHGSSSNNSHSACFASSDTKSAAAATISSCWNDMPHPIGLGTYMMHRESVATALRSAVQAGYRRIDCAPVYFNEDAIGDALFDITRENIVSRSDLYVVSKLPSPFHRNVEAAVRKTINDLRLDYLDLYLVHWPVAFYPVPIDPAQRGWENEDIDNSSNGQNIDETVSIHETWQGMEAVLQQGLVRRIGVSNMPVMLLHELMSRAVVPPAVNQVEMHPFLQQTKLLAYCQRRGVHVQAYSPLGTPGYKEANEPMVLDHPVLQRIAKAHAVTPAQVCLAWALQRGTTVVVKSSNEQHQRDNLIATSEASSTLLLTKLEIAEIALLDRGYRFFRPQDWWGGKSMAVFD